MDLAWPGAVIPRLCPGKGPSRRSTKRGFSDDDTFVRGRQPAAAGKLEQNLLHFERNGRLHFEGRVIEFMILATVLAGFGIDAF